MTAATEVVVAGGTVGIGDAWAVIVVGNAILACANRRRSHTSFFLLACSTQFSCLLVHGVEVILQVAVACSAVKYCGLLLVLCARLGMRVCLTLLLKWPDIRACVLPYH